MKILRKIFITIFTIILINLIVALAVSFNLKESLINGIIKDKVKEEITSTETYQKETVTITDNEELNEQINEIIDSSEMQELINKYLDITMEGLIDQDNLDEINIEEDILEYLKENKSILEETLGVEITDEMIDKVDSQLEDKDMSKALKQSIRNSSNNLTPTEKNILKLYNLITSIKFKVIISLLIFLDLIIIALLEFSLYKWIVPVSRGISISGIIIIIMSLVTKIIISNIFKVTNYNLTNLLVTGIVILIIGLITIIAYKLVNKYLKGDNYEVSNLSKN